MKKDDWLLFSLIEILVEAFYEREMLDQIY
jgi:hypothetical protein